MVIDYGRFNAVKSTGYNCHHQKASTPAAGSPPVYPLQYLCKRERNVD